MGIHRPSARAQIVERRTYLRPLNEEGTEFETPTAMLERVISHQRWLWERQIGRALNEREEAELAELRALMDAGRVTMSGRVKWMGGTDLIKERSSSAFNCSFSRVETPADLVDVFWLLLQGCGTGFKPVTGLLTGFHPSLKTVGVIPSKRRDKGGQEDNSESFAGGVWTLRIGDSAKAWAKALGKLLAGKYPAHTLVLDMSQLRPAGKRLKGYGWLSSGWKPLEKALREIAALLIAAGPRPLTAIEIGDIVNHLGTVLSSRRSAQIWLHDDKAPMINEFIDAKVDRFSYYRADGSSWLPPADFDWQAKGALDHLNELARAEGAKNRVHREQSNNSILFWQKPERGYIVQLLTRILAGGEPGFINAAEAKRRAPEFEGVNPCAEILLPNKGFCNLVQVVWHRFNGDFEGLLRAQWIAGRANYRQTCVNMKDGVLQLAWNDNQHLLRLCGVAPLGYVSWEGLNDPHRLRAVAEAAREGCCSMADDFGTPRPRRVTQVQPGGTSSKHLGHEGDEVHEGAHLALSRWIFNNVAVSVGEPLLDMLLDSGYRVRPHPRDPNSMIVTIPVEYPESPLFTRQVIPIDGALEIVEINTESAVQQLERYRLLMENYVDHNCSITVSFDDHEIDEMADWFMAHWDSYVGVSFLKRNDPTRSARDLGFAYLPQEVVSKRLYDEYVETLLPLDLSGDKGADMIDMGECASGACPVR